MASLAFLMPPLLFLISLSAAQVAVSHTLKAKISCLDCPSNYDFSGNVIMVKCKKAKEAAIASTEADGSFETKIPWGSSNCMAKLVGGPRQLYGSRNTIVSPIIRYPASNFFTLSTPLIFSTRIQPTDFADSKTLDFPLPSEWGLPPSSYYFPVLPIIGIP